MSKMIRVARDGSAAVFSTETDYVTVDSSGTVLKKGTLPENLEGKSWRRPLAQDLESFSLSQTERQRRLPADALNALSIMVDAGLSGNLSQKILERGSATPTEISRILEHVETFSNIASSTNYVTLREWCSNNAAVVAAADTTSSDSGFSLSDDLEYYGSGPETGVVTDLLAVTAEGTILAWDGNEFVEISDTLDEYDAPYVVDLDDDEVLEFIQHIEGDSSEPYIIKDDEIDEEEAELFSAALPSLDLEMFSTIDAVVADATGYSSLERSRNAMRQARGPGGTFIPQRKPSASLADKKRRKMQQNRQGITAGPQENRSEKLSRWHRARLKFILPLILDPDTTIEDWISSNPALWNLKSKRYGLTAAAEFDLNALYFAVVDPDDHEAVYDIVAIQADGDGTPMAWKRSEGAWIESPEMVEEFKSTSPPPVVQLEDEEQIKDVLAQIDEFDQKNPSKDSEDEPESEVVVEDELALNRPSPFAMPDGSFLIETEEDLISAIESYEESNLDDEKIRLHIRKRARALNREDLIPDSWDETAVADYLALTSSASLLYGEYGEVNTLVAAGVPGVADTPSDFEAVTRLKNYWKYGKGAAKIRWATPGDLTRCHRHLSKYMPGRAWGYCQTIHQELFGVDNYTRDNKGN